MKVIAIIQARMGSSRLPGKVLKQVNGKALLLHQVNRLKNCQKIHQIVIATTIKSEDDQIVELCKNNNIDFFRGSEDDVLERYYETWKSFGGDVIVRLTSDCPLIEPNVVDATIQYYLDNKFDYISNTIERTFPRGLDTEVFSSEVLDVAFNNATLIRDREHVTAYLYTHPEIFNIGLYKDESDYSFYRLTVDTEEDFQVIKNIYEAYKGKEEKLNYSAIITLMKDNPNWKKINEHIEQKKI